MTPFTLVSYGGGVNSTAMLIQMRARGESVDLILFADTGGERPETYAYLHTFGEWLEFNGMPSITIVRKEGNGETLEENCIRKKMLPSLAYGFKSCSQKYKIAPQDKYCNNHTPLRAVWADGKKAVKCIGYDMDESHRWLGKEWLSPKYLFRSPLIEWNMGRQECIETIKRAGLPLPGKSACFFCPANTLPEIRVLRSKHPDLLQRALMMEANAELTSIKGLGRRFNWADFIAKEDAQQEMFCTAVEIDCGCYDG